jgi:chemotaxis regulatin CheY-phosphate phosphatase CheZ
MMAKPINPAESGDSAELQALFDAIAAGAQPEGEPVAAADASGDSAELQALFDSVAAQVAASSPPPGSDGAVFERVGRVLRQLHDETRDPGDGSGSEATELLRRFETRLLRVLAESMSAERQAAVAPALLDALRRDDPALPRQTVDELLRSMGF